MQEPIGLRGVQAVPKIAQSVGRLVPRMIDGHWHAMHVATEVRAKAVMFKTVDLNLDLYRSEFQPLDHELTVPEAAALLLRSP